MSASMSPVVTPMDEPQAAAPPSHARRKLGYAKRIAGSSRDQGAQLRRIVQLQLGQHLGLFVAIDVIWLGHSVLAALVAGEQAERWIYLVGALGSIFVVGIPA